MWLYKRVRATVQIHLLLLKYGLFFSHMRMHAITLLSFQYLSHAAVNAAFSQNTRCPYPGIDRFPRGIFKNGTGLARDRKKADAYLHKMTGNQVRIMRCLFGERSQLTSGLDVFSRSGFHSNNHLLASEKVRLSYICSRWCIR
jgi:hypothetical protein